MSEAQNIFSERSHVDYQSRREWSVEHHVNTYSVRTHTLNPCGAVKGQNIFFSESSPVANQIKGNGA